jgi:hypothetical protein
MWTYKCLVGVGVRKDERVREKSWDLEPVWLPVASPRIIVLLFFYPNCDFDNDL